MSELTVSSKVIDLAAYRAARAASRASARETRYLLWYPGIGYFHPVPSATAVPTRDPFLRHRP